MRNNNVKNFYLEKLKRLILEELQDSEVSSDINSRLKIDDENSSSNTISIDNKSLDDQNLSQNWKKVSPNLFDSYIKLGCKSKDDGEGKMIDFNSCEFLIQKYGKNVQSEIMKRKKRLISEQKTPIATTLKDAYKACGCKVSLNPTTSQWEVEDKANCWKTNCATEPGQGSNNNPNNNQNNNPNNNQNNNPNNNQNNNPNNNQPNNDGTEEEIEIWADNQWKKVKVKVKKVASGLVLIGQTAFQEAGDVANNVVNQVADLIRGGAKTVYKIGGKVYKDFSGAISQQLGGNNKLSSLPDWVNQYPCVLSQQPAGTADGSVIVVGDGKSFILKDGGAAIGPGNYKGQWTCTSDGWINITMGYESASVQGGGAGANAPAQTKNCDQSAYPLCVKNVSWDSSRCFYYGNAENSAKVRYTVTYTTLAAKSPSGVDALTCYVQPPNGNAFVGYYYCSGNQPVIESTVLGNEPLYGIDISPDASITTEDKATIYNKTAQVMDLFTKSTDGQRIIDFDETKLKTALRNLEFYLLNGYRGDYFGYFKKNLENIESLLKSELPQASQKIKQFLQQWDTTTGKYKKDLNDPTYEFDANPPDELIRNGTYDKIAVGGGTTRLVDGEAYRHYAARGASASNASAGQYKDQLDATGKDVELCQRLLKTYMVSINMGSLFGIDKVGVPLPDKENYKRSIAECAKGPAYKGGFLKSKDYQKAISILQSHANPDHKIDFQKY